MKAAADAQVYQTVNPAVLQCVPARAQRVLDVGCGGGALGQALKARGAAWVGGVTFSHSEAALARQHIDQVWVADLNDFDPSCLAQSQGLSDGPPAGLFDCIVCSHVLEHLVAPERLLKQLRHCLAPQGVLVVALPNVLFWKQRLQFVAGRFRYTEGGLMDNTHLRFFDWHTTAQLLRDGGFDVLQQQADGGLPGSRHLGAGLQQRLDQLALRRWPGLFGFQFVLRCGVPMPTPTPVQGAVPAPRPPATALGLA
jgi:SAM-dependent methyltransferase